MNKKLQLLRAFSIIAVVVIHTIPNGYEAIFIRPFTNFCVAMFIFLSGYMTNPYMENIGEFYRKRLARVLIPYILWTICYSLVFKNGISGVIYNLLTTSVCYAFYYCFVYAEFVIITPFIAKVMNKKYSWTLILVQPVFILIVRYVLNFMHIPLEHPLNDIFFCSWFLYYYMGLKLKNYNKRANKGLWIILGILVLLQMIEGVLWYHFGSLDMATSQSKISTMLTNVVLLIIVCGYLNGRKMKDNILNKIFVEIGNCSFGIYLSHILIMTIISNKFALYNILPIPLKTITILVVSFAFVLVGRLSLIHI